MRNLPYDSLSTQHGTILPQGTIPDSQTINRSSTVFTLETTIAYVDDPFDGCAIPSGNLYQCTDGATSAQQDLVPVDYKRIAVEVSQLNSTIILARLVTNASAKAAETTSNTGMLLVIVNNALGLPVPDATVNVTNVSKNVSVTAQTNNQGYVFIANIPPDSQGGYHIVATKNGYSQDMTTSRTPQNPNQTQPDVSVYVQKITTQTLAIDLLATVDVTVSSETGQLLDNIAITATSSKIVQFNPSTPKNVYTVSTDANGLAHFTNVEWDSYALTASGNYNIVTTSPYQNVKVDPNDTQVVALVITTNAGWPRINDVSPQAGTAGSTVQVVITGVNFASGTTVKLHRTGYADIDPTITNVAANQKSVTVTFNLTAVAAGDWDIVLTSSSQTATQTEGFTVS